MKVLVFGASGSGKTYVSRALQAKGLAAFDADSVEGLSAWYNRDGVKVPAPRSAREALADQYAFLWSRKFLRQFVSRYEDVYLFGGSGNVFGMLDLFDRVFFLKVDPALQKERLRHASGRRREMDLDGESVVIWGAWLEEEAARRGIPFIDASGTPEEILAGLQKERQ